MSCPKEHRTSVNKLICYSNIWGLLVVIAMVKERSYFVVTSADEKRSESWEPEGNVRTLLGDRFFKGEREKMATVWDSARMFGVANVQSYLVTKLNVNTSAEFNASDLKQGLQCDKRNEVYIGRSAR